MPFRHMSLKDIDPKLHEHLDKMTLFKSRLIAAGLSGRQADGLLDLAWRAGHIYGYYNVWIHADDICNAIEAKTH